MAPHRTVKDRWDSFLAVERPLKWQDAQLWIAVGGSALGLLLLWSYWPTLVEMVKTWYRVQDYSHGFLIPIIAVVILIVRRERFPGWASSRIWPGLVLVTASVVIRYFGARWFLGGVDGWSLLLALAGAVWMLLGTRVFVWALPAIAFLVFMVPLPYRFDHGLSVTLQGISTKLSCWTLQLLGQPALAEGNTIWLGDIQLGVEQACSGLRIFLSIIAIAFAYVAIVRCAWWEKVLLLAAVIPIAMVANATRIVATALFYQVVSSEASRHLIHNWLGYATIVWAAALFGLLLLYLRVLFREMEVVDPRRLLAARRGGDAT